MLNNAILVGRLTDEPKITFTKFKGTKVADFYLAVDKQLPKDVREDFERDNKPTADFIPIKCWDNLAEIAESYLEKGRRVAIKGEVRTRNYPSKENPKELIYVTEIEASEIVFLDRKKESNVKLVGEKEEIIEVEIDPFKGL